MKTRRTRCSIRRCVLRSRVAGVQCASRAMTNVLNRFTSSVSDVTTRAYPVVGYGKELIARAVTPVFQKAKRVSLRLTARLRHTR